MNTHKFRTLLQRRRLTPLLVALLCALAVVCEVASGTAQSPQESTTSSADERQFENTAGSLTSNAD
jgi:hypothetical protein